ncbi:MAG TPA: hypothetical protein VGM05_06315 [Planctomycetaceae bacterium]|jgi:hypothetical protein
MMVLVTSPRNATARRTCQALAAVLFLASSSTAALAAEEQAEKTEDASGDKIQFEKWQKYYRSVAAEYDMEQGKEPPTRLKLQPEPVLSYANPGGNGRGHGAMFVWTREGRPEILGAIWSRQPGDQRYVIHEMHSLSLEPLTATRNDKTFWSPTGPGIEPYLIPSAPEPAATPALRLAQMRSLAREFSATTVRGTVERQLQFRPQPVYRFEKPSAQRDGAVFVGFEDWDPELLMLIETRTTQNSSRWHVGFARFTNLPVSARHKDVRIWSFKESADEGPMGGFDKRFYAVHGVDSLPAAGQE